MKIYVGSTNPVKIGAVEQCLITYPHTKSQSLDVIGVSVPSDVPDMPVGFDEVMQGAKNRAHNLKKLFSEADFYVGIEGGVTKIQDRAYLFGIACIENLNGEIHFGFSPFLEIPKKFTDAVCEQRIELSILQSQAIGIKDIGKKNGSFGLWTNDMLTRQKQFESAFFCAIAPFFSEYYNDGQDKS